MADKPKKSKTAQTPSEAPKPVVEQPSSMAPGPWAAPGPWIAKPNVKPPEVEIPDEKIDRSGGAQ